MDLTSAPFVDPGRSIEVSCFTHKLQFGLQTLKTVTCTEHRLLPCITAPLHVKLDVELWIRLRTTPTFTASPGNRSKLGLKSSADTLDIQYNPTGRRAGPSHVLVSAWMFVEHQLWLSTQPVSQPHILVWVNPPLLMVSSRICSGD